MLSCSRNYKRTRCSPRIIGPAILEKSGRSYHSQEAKGARRGPARHPRQAIWIPEDTINGTPSPEDDRVHHGRVQQERSDRSLDVFKAFDRYLQEETRALEKWCNKWKIDLNSEEMQAIVFKRRPKMRIQGNVRLKDMDIGVAWTSMDHVGQDGLTWGSHIEYATQ